MALILVNDNYYQIIDTESPNKIQFNNRESTAVITFLIKQDQIVSFINDVLGYAQLKNNSYITRQIPCSHPMFPWMYAYKITDIKGYKPDGKEVSSILKGDSTYKNIQVDTAQYVGSYTYYKVTVSFQSRDYNVYTNEQLQPFYQQTDYWMPSSDRFELWTEEKFTYTNRREHWRYCNFKTRQNIQLLTYGGGNFYWRAGEDIPIDNEQTYPISMENNGVNNIKIIKYDVDFNWFFVPFELSIRNQLWLDGFSKVNLYNFLGFPAGTLLFKEIEVTKYDPYYPFATIDLTQNSSVYDYYTEYNKNQYCDIKFKCEYFPIPPKNIITPDPQTYYALNCKSVTSPHNCLIYPRDLSWYYIESAPNFLQNFKNPKGAPIYWNFDFSRLFYYQEGA